MPQKVINKVADLLPLLGTLHRTNPILWFRGHGRANWKLVPALGRRRAWAAAEQNLIKRFKQNAVGLMDHAPVHEWDWLFLMQHHRLPTRLLDWSESPLVGLYFAVCEARHDRMNGALWCLNPIKLNKVAGISFSNDFEIPAFGDPVLDNNLPSRIVQEAQSDRPPVAGLASRSNERIYAQMGVFTITHRKHLPIEKTAGEVAYKLIIPASAKRRLRRELTHLRITHLSLFPELENVSRLAAQDSI